jgi:hypothetical protein
VPEALSRVIARMLEKDPCQRHPCASVAADELDSLRGVHKRRRWVNHDAGGVSAARQEWHRMQEGAIGEVSLAG